MNRLVLTLASLAGLGLPIACASRPAEFGERNRPTAVAPIDDATIRGPVEFVRAADDVVMPVMAADVGAAAAPATQPAGLPKGHPDISAMMQQRKQADQGAAANPAMPVKPAMPGAGGGKDLPAGHPDISEMMRRQNQSAAAPASTQPVLLGTFRVQVVQGTIGGPAIGAGAAVVVDLHHGDHVHNTVEGALDAAGTFTVNDVPVNLGVQPVVKVTYAGVEYQAVGNVMEATDAVQVLQVPVYEATEAAPAWGVKMQHVMVAPAPGGLRVTEMLALENPSDRAWVGTAASDGKRRTFALTLPPGATDVEPGQGFHGACCVKVEGNTLTQTMPLTPGVSQYQLAYTLPLTGGEGELAVTTAAPVKHLMVFVPDDGSTVTAEGLESVGAVDMGKGKTRFYKAAALAGGQTVKLTLSGVTVPVAPADDAAGGAAAAIAGGSGQAAKVVAGAGGMLIFLLGGALLLAKSPRTVRRGAKA